MSKGITHVTLATNPFGTPGRVVATLTHDDGREDQEIVTEKGGTLTLYALRSLLMSSLRAGTLPVDYAEIMDDGTFVIRWQIK